jgi:hypothetical protein
VCIIRFIAYDLVVIVAGRKREHCGCHEKQHGYFFDLFVHNYDVLIVIVFLQFLLRDSTGFTFPTTSLSVHNPRDGAEVTVVGFFVELLTAFF